MLQQAGLLQCQLPGLEASNGWRVHLQAAITATPARSRLRLQLKRWLRSLLLSGRRLIAQDLLPQAVALAKRIERRVEVDALHGVARAVVAQLRRAVGERIVPVTNIAEVMNLHATPRPGMSRLASYLR